MPKNDTIRMLVTVTFCNYLRLIWTLSSQGQAPLPLQCDLPSHKSGGIYKLVKGTEVNGFKP